MLLGVRDRRRQGYELLAWLVVEMVNAQARMVSGLLSGDGFEALTVDGVLGPFWAERWKEIGGDEGR